ncbi:MAG: HD domain-containing protein [Myxococcota bacterium]
MQDRIDRAQLPPGVLKLSRKLASAGYEAWIVGGCIRDLLLGRAASDWDVATNATPTQVQRCFRRVVPTGIQHGTVTVLDGSESYEVTTFRGDGSYSDGRRPDRVHFVDQIDADLARRDYTVNAIAYDPIHDRFADPFDGRRDLLQKTLRTVGVPTERFGEDGLRILRGARFCATLDFELESETEAAFEGALANFRRVSRERVRDEWLKAMKSNKPSKAFEVMRRTGILEITLPELLDQCGCEQNRHHAFDVWTHTMRTLDLCDASPTERMAALLHDIGKPQARARSEKTGDWTFHNHESIGAQMADRWLRDYRFSSDERAQIVHLVRHHLICYTPEWSDAAVRRFLQRVGPTHIEPLLRLARADVLAKGRPVDQELDALQELRLRIEQERSANSALNVQDLAINGKDVMRALGSRGGPEVGRALRFLLDCVVERPELNEREDLLRTLTSADPSRFGLK